MNSALRRLAVPALLGLALLAVPPARADVRAAPGALSAVEEEAVLRLAVRHETAYRERLSRLRRLRDLYREHGAAGTLAELDQLYARGRAAHGRAIERLQVMLDARGRDRLRTLVAAGRAADPWPSGDTARDALRHRAGSRDLRDALGDDADGDAHDDISRPGVHHVARRIDRALDGDRAPLTRLRGEGRLRVLRARRRASDPAPAAAFGRRAPGDAADAEPAAAATAAARAWRQVPAQDELDQRARRRLEPGEVDEELERIRREIEGAARGE